MLSIFDNSFFHLQFVACVSRVNQAMVTRGEQANFSIGKDRKSTRLNSSHANISYAVFCLKKKNKIVHHLQCGFRGNHSCSYVVHKVVSDCLEFRSRNQLTSLLVLDFSKAFDCVDHEILSVKLKSLVYQTDYYFSSNPTKKIGCNL